MKKYAIVLAAGKGTRMKTEMPKCAYSLLKKPMIAYIVENLKLSTMIDQIIIVVGHKKEVIKEILNNGISYADQVDQLGTGHAVMVTESLIDDLEGDVMILPGDMPLVDNLLIEKAFKEHIDRRHDLTVVTTKVEDPFGYGRILRDEQGYLDEIIEEREASASQRLIDEINTGIYVLCREDKNVV